MSTVGALKPPKTFHSLKNGLGAEYCLRRMRPRDAEAFAGTAGALFNVIATLESDALRHSIPPPNQITHGVGFYSECVRMCLMSLSLLAAVYPHPATSQAKGRSPV